MATTMRTFLTRAYDDDNADADDGNKQPGFFRQQPTLVGCIPVRGVVGDFYNDDNNEDDDNGDDYGDDDEDVFDKDV